MLQSEYDVIVKNKRLKILLIILTALMVGIVLFVTIKFGRNSLSTPMSIPPKETENLLKSSPEPQKTDFGTDLPMDFPNDIPIEEGATLTQSYSLDYPEQKQLSIVFPSTKTVKENFTLYTDFTKKQDWTIANQEEGNALSFLYATKEGMDMNVTITEADPHAIGSIPQTDIKEKPLPPAKSQVSVSVLRK